MQEYTSPLVSVIIPAYNAGRYIAESVGSVLKQTYAEVEAVCFNDASSDNTLEKLKELAESDKRIRIIDSKVNIKQGGGRNRALLAARGEYVMFLDADDSLAPDAVETCIGFALRKGADMVMFDYERNSPSTGHKEPVCQLGKDAAYLGGDELRLRIISRTSPVWSAMYKRSNLLDNKLFFPERVFYEDNAVAMAMQLSALNPCKINRNLYLYRVDNISVSRSADNYRFFDRLESAKILMEHLKRLGIYDKYADELDFVFLNQYYIHSIFGCVYRFSKVPMLRHRYICKTVRRYVRHPAENPQYRALPLKMRLKIELHARFPRTMKTISNIKHTLLR